MRHNKAGSTVRITVINAVFAVLLLSTLFLSHKNFIESDILPKWYAFILGTAILINIIIFSTKIIKIKTDRIFIFTLIFSGYLLLRNCMSGNSVLNILTVLSFILLYFTLNIYRNRKTPDFEIIIIFCAVLEALYGISQYIGIFRQESSLGIMSSFDNPAGFAACLVSAIPFCIPLINGPKPLKYSGSASLAILITAIILSGSRAGIISVIIVILIYIGIKYKNIFRKHLKLTVLFSASLAILILFLIFLKKDSALGRVLIWNNTISMISDRPILGFGPGGFHAEYMNYQAAYFANDPESKFAQLADNSATPFNEYLNLTAEYGLIGLLLLSIIFILLTINRKFSLIPFLCLTSIAVFSCFSYPMRYPFVWVLIAYCLSEFTSVSEDKKTLTLKNPTYIRLLYLIVFFVISLFLFRDIKFEREWGKLARKSPIIKNEKLLDSYSYLYNVRNGNPLFLYNYGAVLNQHKAYGQSNLIMSECEKYFNDYDVQMILGKNNMNTGNLRIAENHYKTAHNMVPNRFMPLSYLMDLYIMEGDYKRARETAEIIVVKKVKVHSPTVNEIIKKAETFINDHNE